MRAMRARRFPLCLLFNLTLLAAAGAALGWGPLAASLPVIIVLGLAGATIGGAVGW